MGDYHPSNPRMEQSGALFDALLAFSWAVDDFAEKLSDDPALLRFKKLSKYSDTRDWYGDLQRMDASIEVSGLVISVNGLGEFRFQHPHYFVEFLVSGGECWAEARGMFPNARSGFIAWLNSWTTQMNDIYAITLTTPCSGKLVLS